MVSHETLKLLNSEYQLVTKKVTVIIWIKNKKNLVKRIVFN